MSILSTARAGMRLLPAVGLAIAITPLTISAERIYKWVDEDGNTVYSGNPPPRGTEAERVRGAPPPPVDPEAAMEALRKRAEEFGERREARQGSDQKSDQAAEQAKRRREHCEKLREDLKVIQNNPRVRERKGDEEEYTVLTEEQRQERLESIRKRIEEECTGSD